MTSALCKSCGETKDLSDFNRKAQAKNGHQSVCRRCDNKRHKDWWERVKPSSRNQPKSITPDMRHASYIKGTYNISIEQYIALVEAQGGGCAVCGKTSVANGRNLAVDHDHDCCPGSGSCGKCVRGVLCDRCNRRLVGGSDNDPSILINAANYLIKWRKGFRID